MHENGRYSLNFADDVGDDTFHHSRITKMEHKEFFKKPWEYMVSELDVDSMAELMAELQHAAGDDEDETWTGAVHPGRRGGHRIVHAPGAQSVGAPQNPGTIPIHV